MHRLKNRSEDAALDLVGCDVMMEGELWNAHHFSAPELHRHREDADTSQR